MTQQDINKNLPQDFSARACFDTVINQLKAAECVAKNNDLGVIEPFNVAAIERTLNHHDVQVETDMKGLSLLTDGLETAYRLLEQQHDDAPPLKTAEAITVAETLYTFADYAAELIDRLEASKGSGYFDYRDDVRDGVQRYDRALNDMMVTVTACLGPGAGSAPSPDNGQAPG